MKRDEQAMGAKLPAGLICPAVEPLPDTEGWRMGSGAYRAVRASGDVIVYAEGLTPTPGYDVRIVRQDPDQTPPHLHLYWKPPPPDMMVAQVLKRYAVCVHIPHSRSIGSVTIEDADGVHELKVERVK